MIDAYRYLLSAKVIDQLEDFEIQPSKYYYIKNNIN